MRHRKCEHVYTNREANVAPKTRSDQTASRLAEIYKRFRLVRKLLSKY
jgi:hypothetical protein